MAFGFVGIDRDHGYPFGGIISIKTIEAILRADDVGAMIAGKKEDQNLGGFEISQ
jgi:hypothetical protein